MFEKALFCSIIYLMKDKKFTIISLIIILILFVAVLVTSILITQKKDDLDKIPMESTQEFILDEVA